MPVTRPSRYPIVAQTPGGNYAEPGSGVQLGGWQTGAIFPSADANWLMRQITDWGRSLDASRLASTDLLDANVVQRVSTTALTITTGGGTTLTAEITAGGVYYGNGERIDLTDAATVYSGVNALVFPAGSTRYVIARPQPATGGAVSGSSTAELAISALAVVAGWSTLMTVTTGATTITSAAQHGDVINAFQFGSAVIFADTLECLDLATFSSFATFNDLTDFNAKTTFTVGSEWSVNEVTPAIKATQLGAGAVIEAVASGTGEAIIATGGGVSPALSLTDGLLAISTQSATFGASLYGVGAIDVSFMLMIAAAGAGAGLYCVGSSTGIEAAYFEHSATVDATTVYTRTSNSADVDSRALKAQGRGSAAGLEAIAAANYPAILTGDTTNPTYGSLFAASQNAAPTDFSSGSLTFVGGAIDSWGHGSFNDSAWRYFHSTLGGRMYGFATGGPTLNSNSAVYTTLCTVTIPAGADAAKVAGRTARLTVSMRVGHSAAATNFCDVQIRDTTAGATLTTRAGTGIGSGNGYYLPAVASVWLLVINFEIEYTVPATGARTFVLEFKRNGAGSNVTAEGSLKVEGLY